MISEKPAPRAEPIDERAAAGVHQRVREQEDRRQRAELGVGERNVALNRGDRDRQRLPIEVADRDRRRTRAARRASAAWSRRCHTMRYT